MDRRKKMDQNIANGTGITTQKSQKRGNNDKLEDKRWSKKRKFAIVGEDWGDKKGSSGLELRVEEAANIRSTGPLLELEPVHRGVELGNGEPGDRSCTGPLLDIGPDVNNGNHMGDQEGYQQEGRSQEGTPPLLGNIDQGVAGKSNSGRTEDRLNVSTGPLLTDGPYKLVGNNDVGVEHETEELTGNSQLGTTSTMEHVSTKDVIRTNNEDNLYDTAATVQILREDRGSCSVRRGWCREHNSLAKKITSTKKVWTKNKRTGLFSYCSRKMSVWRCDENMGTLPRTMGPRDGAGEAWATGGDGMK